MSTYIKIFFSGFVFLLPFLFCTSTQVSKEREQAIREFPEKNWSERAGMIASYTPNPTDAEMTLLALGIQDEHPAVISNSIESIGRYQIEKFRDSLYITMEHPNPVLRWKSLVALGRLEQKPEDFSRIVEMSRDEDWMVREEAMRLWRRYEDEQDEKNHFFDALFRLKDKEPGVLREVYKTLAWYDDSRSLPFLYKRSFHASSAVELAIIVDALASYNYDNRIRRRLFYLARKHESPIVRMSARDALDIE